MHTSSPRLVGQTLLEPTNPKQSEEDDTSSSGDVVPVPLSPIYEPAYLSKVLEYELNIDHAYPCTSGYLPLSTSPLPLQTLFEPTNPKQSEEDDTASSDDMVPVPPHHRYRNQPTFSRYNNIIIIIVLAGRLPIPATMTFCPSFRLPGGAGNIM